MEFDPLLSRVVLTLCLSMCVCVQRAEAARVKAAQEEEAKVGIESSFSPC